MRIFRHWLKELGEAGGWRGLGTEIGNYNAPFAYVMLVAYYLPGPLIFKVKALWIVCDVIMAFFAYRIVALRWPGSRIPIAAALVTLLLPTVAINAAFWGQMDAMWAGAALAGVYYLLRDKPWWGLALFGVAVAIKPQGIFILPLAALLVLSGHIPWRTLLAAPAAFLVLDLPAIALGRNPIELLTIYSMNRQAENVPELSLRAANVFAFLPAVSRVDTARNLGYLFCAALVVGVLYVLVARAVRMTPERIVTAAALFSILVPFALPGMHERYFYLADVMTLILAVYRPKLFWYVPMLVQAASFVSYERYLFGPSPLLLPMVIPASLMLAALIIVGYRLLSEAFVDEPSVQEPERLPEVPDSPAEISRRPAEKPELLPARRA
jgi:Gpi18-like mannosyltransferase